MYCEGDDQNITSTYHQSLGTSSSLSPQPPFPPQLKPRAVPKSLAVFLEKQFKALALYSFKANEHNDRTSRVAKEKGRRRKLQARVVSPFPLSSLKATLPALHSKVITHKRCRGRDPYKSSSVSQVLVFVDMTSIKD